MGELSYTTINILALSKVLLVVFFVCLIWLIFKIRKPWPYLVLVGSTIILFYLILSWPLQRMWWGNVGDELFTAAYLSKSLLGNPLRDFYYDWLPNFYPPLYFWVTGLFSRLFTTSPIVAGKIGVAGTLLIWFFGSYGWQKFFWHKIKLGQSTASITGSAWFWFCFPLFYLLLLDFDTIIFKPYETIAALFGILFVGLLAQSFYLRHWPVKYYFFFGLTGGLIFLTYYFWWLIFIPAIFVLIYLSDRRWLNLRRSLLVGGIVFLIGSIFILPLLWSYWQYGLENHQGTYMIPSDFFTYLPWSNFSWRSLLYILGLAGLVIFWKKSLAKSSLVILIICYIYQFLNLVYFLLGRKPILPSKPFMFLGIAALAIGLSYLAIYGYRQYLDKLSLTRKRWALILACLVLITRWPLVYFIDDPVSLRQLEIDLVPTKAAGLAADLKFVLPDYQQRTWLTTGSLDLNAYLPIPYYLAHNIHFSHHAAQYELRMAEIISMTQAQTPDEFMAILKEGRPRPIDTLLLYDSDSQSEYYTLYFWADNFPNGGRDTTWQLPKKLISNQHWDLIYQKNNWFIYTIK